MLIRRPALAPFALLSTLLLPLAAGAQVTPPVSEPLPIEGDRPRVMLAPAGADPAEPGRFDGGRMWTFDVPPAEYFATTYGIAADAAWFERARLGSLRIPNCSASFVSPDGLVLTNHHCARDFVAQADRGGEGLLDDGFYAETLADEREVEGFTADQLIEIRDVTDQIQDHLGDRSGPERAQRLEEKTAELEREIHEDFDEAEDILVEVVALYDGGRYSAYVFRRWERAKLVMAPELQMGFFGGDADNFTFPRYNLDMALFRLYDEDDTPIESPDYFRWSMDGVRAGDPVFIVGNPGETNRQQTVAQLLFRREVEDRAVLEFVTRRAEAIEEVIDAFPELAEEYDLRNDWFSAQNSIKAIGGALAGLEDPAILARKEAAERALQEAIEADAELMEMAGSAIERIARLQEEKREIAPGFGAFLGLTAAGFESPTLHRAILAFQVLNARQAGAPAEALEGLLAQIDSVGNAPPELDDLLIEARIQDFLTHYDVEDERWLQSILRGRTPEGTATAIRSASILADSAATVEGMRTGRIDANDPALRFVAFYVTAFADFQGVFARLSSQEDEALAALGRARFALRGWDVPPDATFTPRIADGVVTGYDYNGTRAPAFTTYWGVWDRNAAFDLSGDGEDAWDLPERWNTPPAGMDLSTPLNFVSTVDITGGNSGSPVLDAELRIVGVVFDGNIESLPGDYIFLPEANRSITVDARGILEALEHVYGATRIVEELRAGAGVATDGAG